VELERRLLDPRIRRDRGALEALLHDDFTEFGVAGGVYDKASIIAALRASEGVAAEASGFRATRLGPDAVLVTYRTDAPSFHTSIWVREPGRSWQARHHQGTPTTP
jgi:ribonuclease HI